MILERALKKERINRYGGQNVLMKNQPTPKDKFLLFQSSNLLLICLIKGYKNWIFLGSPPKSNLRYSNGRRPCLQFITKAASCNHNSTTLTPNNIHLWKLIFKQEISSKRINTTFNALTLVQLLTPTDKVPSANCKWETEKEKEGPLLTKPSFRL